MKISIIDYGLGNHLSILNICKKLRYKPRITDNEDEIINSNCIILPGVGSFDKGINNILDRGLEKTLNKAILDLKIKTLGICLGAQLMLSKSEEGKMPGLRYVPGEVLSFKKKFSSLNIDLPVPNMGWRHTINKSDPNLYARYYFVHSFYFSLLEKNSEYMSSNYGFPFICDYKYKNITGFQFHPEKSHSFGLKLLKNYFENF